MRKYLILFAIFLTICSSCKENIKDVNKKAGKAYGAITEPIITTTAEIISENLKETLDSMQTNKNKQAKNQILVKESKTKKIIIEKNQDKKENKQEQIIIKESK